ncbi:MAG: COG1361 S-layer family protein [Candidatus Hydrothermarchaeales archaeon]
MNRNLLYDIASEKISMMRGENKESRTEEDSKSGLAKLIFSFLFTIFILTTVNAVPVDFYVMEVSPQIVSPGESTSLNITLKNLAPNYAVYLKATLDPSDTSPIDAIGIPRRYIDRVEGATESDEFFGVISQDVEISLSMPIYVKQSATEGIYQVPLVLEWKNEILEDVTQTLYLGIKVEEQEAEFTVIGVSPTKITPEETTNIEIRIKNSGSSSASKIKATLDQSDTSPVNVLGPSKVDIERSKVGPGEEFVITYLVHVKTGNDEDVYNTPLRLEWEDMSGVSQTSDLDLGIQIKGDALLRVAKISTSPVEFIADLEKGKVTITVENAGKTTAKSVKVEVEYSEPFTEAYSGASSDFVSEIAPDKSHDFQVALDIDEDAEAGSFSIPLKLTYRTTEKSYSVTEDVIIKISSKAKFETSEATTNPGTINPGDDFIANVPITNNGQEKAESVKVVLKTKSYFTGVKTDYLGDIKPGESKIATFDLKADRDTIPDNYESDIKIIWNKGEDRLEETTSFGITVSKVASEGRAPSGVILGVLVAAGAVGVVLWRKLR